MAPKGSLRGGTSVFGAPNLWGKRANLVVFPGVTLPPPSPSPLPDPLPLLLSFASCVKSIFSKIIFLENFPIFVEVSFMRQIENFNLTAHEIVDRPKKTL